MQELSPNSEIILNSDSNLTETHTAENTMNDLLRHLASEQLSSTEVRLPFIDRLVRGRRVYDANDFEQLNSTLGEETRTNILRSITGDIHNTQLLRTILSHMSPETLGYLRAVTEPVINMDNYVPVLNLLMYGNVGINDFNVTVSTLQGLLIEEAATQTEEIPDNVGINETKDKKDDTNEEIRKRSENAEIARTNILTNINWRTIAIRGLALGAGVYFGSSYVPTAISLFGGLGTMLFQSNEEFGGTMINPRGLRVEITWGDVSKSFWNTWAMLAKFMADRK